MVIKKRMDGGPKGRKNPFFLVAMLKATGGEAERGLQKLFCLTFSSTHDVVCCPDCDTYMKYFNEDKKHGWILTCENLT